MNPALASCAALLVALLALNPPACAHWPDQPSHQMAQLGELKLEGGGAISNLQMSYVTHGKLNAAKDNAILFLHGLLAVTGISSGADYSVQFAVSYPAFMDGIVPLVGGSLGVTRAASAVLWRFSGGRPNHWRVLT
jgi:homoserine acetyltransferase